ncbi:Putative major facilitator superfamily, MFS transporter superfamily [Septoria linicola]|uniref:Major facilitator superfamily, MFS transporter superfamily n=1 Tax=Septoria linicola TaxID=215465 RepID=A0A9Q9EJX0_9PEZI|nr:Putative major facilitator superfamily, MFS transporter superfamily [Septoria linicola]
MASPRTDDVPGTIRLIDDGIEAEGLQNRILLVPQPSRDPEDPLNWSRKRKFWSLLMVFTYTLGVGIPTTLHYSVIADITRDTGISTADLVQGNGMMFLFLGWGCLFWQAIATGYGRRGVYLIFVLLTVPIMVWTAYSRSAGEWYAHRIIIGIVCAPIEALPEISIADVFFAHDRGTWMATYVMVLFGSNFIAPLIAGWMSDGVGWRWTMHIGAIIAAVAFAIFFFGLEETMYFRKTFEGVAVMSRVEGASEVLHHTEKEAEQSWEGKPPSTSPSTLSSQDNEIMHITPSPRSYKAKLGWFYNVLNGTASPVLSAAPYDWRAAYIGCIYVGPLIGAALGCLWSGWASDRLALYLARRNGGVREPEHRLYALTIAGVFSAARLITWGVGAQHGVHWIGLAFGLGMMVFGLVVGGGIGLSYAIDCFKEVSTESMASVIIIRNTIGFGFSYAITPWYTTMGLQNCFILAACVALACMATFVLMIWKGKDLRRMSAKTYWQYVESSMGTH